MTAESCCSTFGVKIAPAFEAHLQMAENLDKQLAAK
jgi:hypothetical protein